MGLLDRFRRKRRRQFPPVPDWKPDFSPDVSHIVDRVRYYTDGNSDIAVFQHGTCVLLDDGLSDEEAAAFALDVLSQIFNYHPDMNPVPMDDGNILVRYNHPAVNVVISMYYYLLVIKRMYMFEPAEGAMETPIAFGGLVKGVLLTCVILIIVIGIFQGPFVDMATKALAITP